MSKFSESVSEKIVSCNDFEDIYRERRIHGAKRELRTHFGPDTTITAFKAKHKREVSKDKLRDGEVSAVTYTIGNYVIRESTVLYIDDVDTHYLKRIPADKEQVEEFRQQYGERSVIFLGLDGYRPVVEIHAANKDDDEPKWHFVCLTTSARSLVWSESVDFIGTVKKNAFDKRTDLFVLVTYHGDSFSSETWHRLTSDGAVKNYSVHPYDSGSDERAWEW